MTHPNETPDETLEDTMTHNVDAPDANTDDRQAPDHNDHPHEEDHHEAEDPTAEDQDEDVDDQPADQSTGEQDQPAHEREVAKARKQAARYRERAKDAEQRADTLARRLHAALVAADGRLADPGDLEFDEDHLEDPEALAAAVADLIDRKPGLRAQKFTGHAGAGKRGSAPKPPADLISIIRNM